MKEQELIENTTDWTIQKILDNSQQNYILLEDLKRLREEKK